VLYLAIPAQNEVETIGVLLWRLRTVLAEFPREYEVVVYDDASSDETADVAEQYAHAMPVTVLRGTKAVGYAGAVDALVRYVAGHTRYPRRDAMLLLQGDFTDPPGIVPEFARRFEGGADLVVGERTAVVDAPSPVKRLFSAAGWALRPFVRVDGVRDLTGSMRLVRISVLRDALRQSGEARVCEGDSWTANADLLLRLVPHARRVESVPMEPTYGVRMRETRRVTVRDALATLRWGWRARGRRAVPSTAPESSAEQGGVRTPRNGTPTAKRRDEPELTAERLREKSRERVRPRGDSSLEDAEENARRDRGRRDRRDARADSPSSDQRNTPPVRALSPQEETPDPFAPLEREPRPPRESRRELAAEALPPDGKRTSSRLRDDAADAENSLREKPHRGERGRGASNDRQGSADRDGASNATGRSGKRPDVKRPPEGGRPRSVDDNVELGDPFAPPASSRQRVPSATDASTAVPVRTDAATDRPATTRDTHSDAPRSDSVIRADGDLEVSNGIASVTPDENGDEIGDGDVVIGEPIDDAARERKRRRNRRSRKRKTRGRNPSGDVESATDDGLAGGSDESTEESGVFAGHVETLDNDANDDSGSSDDTSDGSTGNDEAGESGKVKRRGRRGRRGGARRARNRGRTTGGDDLSGDSGAEPDTGGGDGQRGADGASSPSQDRPADD